MIQQRVEVERRRRECESDDVRGAHADEPGQRRKGGVAANEAEATARLRPRTDGSGGRPSRCQTPTAAAATTPSATSSHPRVTSAAGERRNVTETRIAQPSEIAVRGNATTPGGRRQAAKSVAPMPSRTRPRRRAAGAPKIARITAVRRVRSRGARAHDRRAPDRRRHRLLRDRRDRPQPSGLGREGAGAARACEAGGRRRGEAPEARQPTPVHARALRQPLRQREQLRHDLRRAP